VLVVSVVAVVVIANAMVVFVYVCVLAAKFRMKPGGGGIELKPRK